MLELFLIILLAGYEPAEQPDPPIAIPMSGGGGGDPTGGGGTGGGNGSGGNTNGG